MDHLSIYRSHAMHPQNRLVSRLPREDQERLFQKARLVTLSVGDVACEPGRTVRYVHFPTSGILSSIIPLRNGEIAEAASIGNEGVTGLSSVVDTNPIPYRIVQRIEGQSLRVPTDDFRTLLRESPTMQELIGRYTLALLQEYAQNAACNLHHRVTERMCRWLLTTADRVGRDHFPVTQELLSQMLGVSRQSINATAGALQQESLIEYRRGKLILVDRVRLESIACECYRATKEAYENLVGTSDRVAYAT